MGSTLTLEGKIAFVTGSTRGIGWGIAQKLAREGAVVYLNGVSDQNLLQAKVEELKKIGCSDSDGFLCGVHDRKALKQCYDEIFKRHKRLDILINNAGILEPSLLAMAGPENIDRTLDINVKGVIYNMQYASRLMAKNRSGSIVNISSLLGRVGMEGMSIYSTSKAAVIGLTLSTSVELASQNIRVNAVAPGFIDTEMVQRGLTDEQLKERVKMIPQGRLGTPEDVANAVYFLASDLSQYVTGQVLGVDGGIKF